MIRKKYKANVKNGQVVIKEQDIFNKELTHYEGKEIVVTIGKEYITRSLPQNSYYWGVPVEMLSEETGHTPDEIHELLKAMFLKKHLDIKLKDKIERYKIIKSTTSLDKMQWEEYMDKIRQFATEKFQLYIPLPNECEYDY